MRVPFFHLAIKRREHKRRWLDKKISKLDEVETKEQSTAAASVDGEAKGQPTSTKPRGQANSSPPKPGAGVRFVGFGESRRKYWVRRNSEFRGNPYRRWRLRWRGNLFGGRRKLSTGIFTKFWGKYSEVGEPPLLLEGL